MIENFDYLFKLRLIVARFGEMDRAGWWNTKGQLGRIGAISLRRGFPRTHHFAQARSVFAVAAQRCAEVFDSPGCVTLWRMPESVEESFDARWEYWIEKSDEWISFFERIEPLPVGKLSEFIRTFELVDDDAFAAFGKLRHSAGERAVPLPGLFSGTNANLALLALGFGCSEESKLAVPYFGKAEA